MCSYFLANTSDPIGSYVNFMNYVRPNSALYLHRYMCMYMYMYLDSYSHSSCQSDRGASADL